MAPDERCTLRARDEPDRSETVAGAALERLKSGAGRCAFDEERLARTDAQRGEQRAHHGAQVEDIRTGRFEREVRRQRMQLRPLCDQELLMAAGVGLVALDGEPGVHRVARRERREQVALARVDRDQVAHLDATLTLHLAADRRHEGDAARTGHLMVKVVILERRHRDTGKRPDIIEVDLGGEHIDQCLVRLRMRDRQQDLALRVLRQAVRRRAGRRVAYDRVTVLPTGQWRESGEERCADRQQFAPAHHRCDGALVIDRRVSRTAHRQGCAALVEEGLDPGFSTLRIDHRLGEQLRLARQSRCEPLLPAGAHGIEDPRRSRSTADTLGLRE